MNKIDHAQRAPALSANAGESCSRVALPGPIYAVASPANGSGKTSLAAALVAALPGSTAIKFTTVRMDGSRCPRNAGSCACHSLHGDYTIIDDPAVILQPGTDTARLAEAGARQVLWCLAWPGAYPAMLQVLSRRLDHGPLVIEGNTILGFIPEARIFFVLRPDQSPRRFKKSTLPLLARSELILLNDAPGTGVDFRWKEQQPDLAAHLHTELDRLPVHRADLRLPASIELLRSLGLPGIG